MDKAAGVVILTGLIPTRGHLELIRFAREFLANLPCKLSELTVIICSRSFEPVSAYDRYKAFHEELIKEEENNSRCAVHIKSLMDDKAPQNPGDIPDFWGWWRNTLLDLDNSTLKWSKNRYIFSSETYGNELAKVLNAQHVPFDVKREFIKIKGTDVRKDILNRFSDIMPSYQKMIKKVVTVFGAESVGKTTVANAIAKYFNGLYVPEYARQYLETVGPELSDEKMNIIANGQTVLQDLAWNTPDYPVIIQDSDILNTIGYFRIYGIKPPASLIEKFLDSKADLYILLSSDVEFVPDQLRYGKDKRESTDEFWENLLKEYDCNYKYINSDNYSSRKILSIVETYELLEQTYRPIRRFERD